MLSLLLLALAAGPQQGAEEEACPDKAAKAQSAKCRPADEHVEVTGRYIGPESIEAIGRYTLSRDFLDSSALGNGNITDQLAILPGVQLSENSLDVSNLAELKPALLTISGGQPWQTGFFLDGLNFNSRLDPAATGVAAANINQVQGHPQGLFINQAIVDSVTVFDNNIPAEYGNFSGGVVDAKTRDPRQSPAFSFQYRGTRSDWGQYRVFEQEQLQEDDLGLDDGSDNELRAPVFEKDQLNMSASRQMGDHSLLFSASATRSRISELSFNQPKVAKRRSSNFLLKYGYQGWLDELNLTAVYAPYRSEQFVKDTKDSDFTLDGGGGSLSLEAAQALGPWYWRGKASGHYSQSSREAPQAYLPWLRAPGKAWGLNSGDIPLSKEGGFGSLENRQLGFRLDQSLARSFSALGADHQFKLGYQLEHQALERDRHQPAYTYNSPVRDADIICNGQTLDCVEQAYHRPLVELEAELGEPLDLLNPEHFALYSANVAMRGQYFQMRRLYPEEHIQVQLLTQGLYLQDDMAWQRFGLNLGLRLDHDDVLKNLNLAPRLQLSYDLLGDGDTLLLAGLNRYYDANLLTYKIREAQVPYVVQYRPIVDGAVQSWMTSGGASRFRYRYQDLDTPYSDELVLGLKQALWGGVLSLKGVWRKGKDQIAQGESELLNGYTYVQQINQGENEHQRVSLSWTGTLGRHSLWINGSYTENTLSTDSYDGTVDNTPEDEIVFLQSGQDYQLVSLGDLNRYATDFSRPVTVNAGLVSQWTRSLTTSLSAGWRGSYDTVVDTGQERASDRLLQVCPECQVSNIYYPVYRKVRLKGRVLLDGAIRWQMPLVGQHSLECKLEINNLLNSRTNLVADGVSGIETGRQFWLGLGYSFP
ncbi:TonB-dependent receptor plug domain-containing protein [Gallaecimonas xiamenensis]|uniref:TonB-dependent receptor plug domain-containing protein n=1 Tax=Gallaecimonas xiamenensis 3-C-1 TaxID=745411 RepID=K2JWF4_9GAMM|nr:TonB-dependent receptor [Gallaecimonas xiamenensis]EKE69565.1 hypothetical protein B3C1_14767 [Gallaecimonas xiamenensis 3-C-1]